MLDPIRATFWEAFRHLFPSHAKAVQTDGGSLIISWSIKRDAGTTFPYATPITVRFEEELIRAMDDSDSEQRLKIAQRQETVLRAGLVGYDPFAAVPKARVIVLG